MKRHSMQTRAVLGVVAGICASSGIASGQQTTPPLGVGTYTLATTAADWGGSTLTTDVNQVGWGGFGDFNSPASADGTDAGGNAITEITPAPFDSTATSNGLVNMRDDFNESGFDSYAGSFSPSGAYEVENYPGGFDFASISSELTTGAAKNTLVLNALGASKWMAIDFTTPFGGTKLDPNAATNQDYFILGFDSLSSTSGITKPKEIGVQEAIQNQYTEAAPDAGSFGDDAGAFVVSNGGNYFTAYLPYSYTPLAAANVGSYTGFKLAVTINSGGSTDGYAAQDGSVILDGYRVMTLDSVWGDITGSFSVATNWLLGVPNGQGAAAAFDGSTVARTVNLDIAPTLGYMTFISASPTTGYTIAGTNTITLDNGSLTALINVQSGTHTVSAPIAVNSSVDVTTAANSTLTLSGSWTLNNATATLQKDGAGVLNMTKVSSAALTINAGTLAVIEGTGGGSLGAFHAPTSGTLGTSVVNGTVTLASTATLDLTTHAMVINYNGEAWATKNYEGIPSPVGELTFGKKTPTQSYPAGTITRYVQTASDGGSWDLPGITSSVAENDFTGTTAVGVIDQNDLFALQGNDYTTANGGPGTWEGVPVANDNNVLVRYTYYGDTNLDGTVNATDVDNLIQGFEGFGDGWLYGDFNYDGIVNGQDVTELIIGFSGQKGSMGDGGISPGQAQFLLSLATGITPAEVAKFDAIVGVPEPTTIGLLSFVGLGLLGRRRTR